MNTHWEPGGYHRHYGRDHRESSKALIIHLERSQSTLLRSEPGARPECGWRVSVTNSVWCLQVYFPAPSTSSNTFLGVRIVNKTQGNPGPLIGVNIYTSPLLCHCCLENESCPVCTVTSALAFLQYNLNWRLARGSSGLATRDTATQDYFIQPLCSFSEDYLYQKTSPQHHSTDPSN